MAERSRRRSMDSFLSLPSSHLNAIVLYVFNAVWATRLASCLRKMVQYYSLCLSVLSEIGKKINKQNQLNKKQERKVSHVEESKEGNCSL